MKTLYGINENGNRKEAWTPTYQGPISLLPPLNTQPMSNKDQHRAPSTALCLKLTNHPLGGKLTTLCPSERPVIDPHRNGYTYSRYGFAFPTNRAPATPLKKGLQSSWLTDMESHIASKQRNHLIVKELWWWAHNHRIQWSCHITAPYKSSQPYRVLEYPTEDTLDVPVQRQLDVVYALIQSYVPNRKNTWIQEPRGRSRNCSHLPSSQQCTRELCASPPHNAGCYRVRGPGHTSATIKIILNCDL